MTSTLDGLKIKSKHPRRHRQPDRVIFQHGRNLAIHLSPEIEDVLSLVAGLDLCEQELRGSEVVLRFKRKTETLQATRSEDSSRIDCIICFQNEHELSQEIMLQRFGATALWQAQKLHDEEQHEVPHHE